MYQSIHDAVQIFQKNKRSKQNIQDKLVLKWKLIAIGLVVILLVIIGICSQLIRSMGKLTYVTINTTFLNELLGKSMFFDELISLRSLTRGLSSTQGIKYDSAKLICNKSNLTAVGKINQCMKDHENLLVLMEVNANSSIDKHRIAMYFHPYFASVDDNPQLAVRDHADTLFSTLISLDNGKNVVINSTQSCFIYKYNNTQHKLSFFELFHLYLVQDNNSTLQIDNYGCFTSDSSDAQNKSFAIVNQIVGIMPQKDNEIPINVNKIEIFGLEMKYVDFSK